MNLKIDEEFRSLIPPLADEEREQLKQNIINDGAIREPIAIWHDFIIDGHNRYEISQETGISFNTFSMDSKLEDRNDVMIWMIENQKGRRNLPQPKKNELAYRLKDMYAERARKNQATHTADGYQLRPKLDKADTLQKMADVAGVSRGTMAKYQKLVESGDKELLHQYNEGEISLNAAYNKVMGIEEKPKPNKELEAANAKIAELEDMLKNNVVEVAPSDYNEIKTGYGNLQSKCRNLQSANESYAKANEELRHKLAKKEANESGMSLQELAEENEAFAQYLKSKHQEAEDAKIFYKAINNLSRLPNELPEVKELCRCYIAHEATDANRAFTMKSMAQEIRLNIRKLEAALEVFEQRKLGVVK